MSNDHDRRRAVRAREARRKAYAWVAKLIRRTDDGPEEGDAETIRQELEKIAAAMERAAGGGT